MQLVLDAEQFLGVAFFKGGDRNAGPARDHFFDISASYFRQDDRFFIVDNRHLCPAIRRAFPFGQRNGQRIEISLFVARLELDSRAGFVDYVDGFVRQKAIGNVTAGLQHGRFQSAFAVTHLMKTFVALAHAFENLDRLILGRRRHFDGLEASLERAILFD